MQGFTRRQSLAVGAATFGAAALGAVALPLVGAEAADSDVPTADVTPPGFQIEKGAALRVLRPAKFVDPDETLFRANTKKFTDTTGIDVRVDFVSWRICGRRSRSPPILAPAQTSSSASAPIRRSMPPSWSI